jgi:hypothetical protein
MLIDIAPASILFSISSFNAADGATTTSPAAILLMQESDNFYIVGASFTILGNYKANCY